MVAAEAQDLEPRLVVDDGDVGDAHDGLAGLVVVVEGVAAEPAEVAVALPAVYKWIRVPSLEGPLAPPLFGPRHREVVALRHRGEEALDGRVVVFVERTEGPGRVTRSRDQFVDEAELVRRCGESSVVARGRPAVPRVKRVLEGPQYRDVDAAVAILAERLAEQAPDVALPTVLGRGRDRGEPGDLAVDAAKPKREVVVCTDRDEVVGRVEQSASFGDRALVVRFVGVVRSLGGGEGVPHERAELVCALVGERPILHTRSGLGTEISVVGACGSCSLRRRPLSRPQSN